MIDITELADKWREDYWAAMQPVYKVCADELTAALPKWTKMEKDNPDYRKSQDMCLVSDWHDGRVHAIAKIGHLHTGEWYRTLCGLDYPPEEVKK